MSYSSTILIVSLFCCYISLVIENHGLFGLGIHILSARVQQERDHAQRCSEAESRVRDANVQFKN